MRISTILVNILLAFFVADAFQRSKAWAAPCCSGSALVPSLITTDSQAQLAVRASQSAVIGTSQNDGTSIFRSNQNNESTSGMSLAAAYSFTPRFQVHIETGFSRRSRTLQTSSDSDLGWGDISTGVAYEVIEQYYYSVWKPRVWAFFDLTAPTGQSVYDRPQSQQDPLMTQIHGRGAWSATIGLYALKTWQNWDLYLMGEHRRSLSRHITVSGQATTITLGPTTVLDWGCGYHWQLWGIGWRFGASVGPQWDGSTRTSIDGIINEGPSRLLWNAAVQISQAWNESWASTLSYSDQTLMGPTYNAELSRTASLMVTRHFD